jgi:hypothetical protein
MTIDFSLLPNFFLIGAAKAGTTTLHDVLQQHPEIFCSQVKETGFFITEDRWTKGLEWYQQTHFSRAAGYPRRGESTAVYLLFSELVAPRLHQVYGNHPLKFLAVLRDPIKRAYSHYWQRIHTGLETLSFAEALDLEEQRLRENREWLLRTGRAHYGYFRGGCYATLLEPYFAIYPSECFHFILLNDLQERFQPTMAEIARFLGVNTDFAFQSVQKNSASQPRSTALSTYLYRPHGILHKIVRFFSHRMPYILRHKLKKGVTNLNLRESSYPPLDPALEARLRLRYADEVRRLEGILGRDLAAWVTPSSG